MATEIKYLVIGFPVEHSRSPGLQNAAFEHYGLGRPYGKLAVDPANIGEFVAYARANLAGVNLTVPHKNVVLPFVDELSPEAAACASVNTLRIDGGRVFGYSTDGDGFAGALRCNFNLELPGVRAVLLGAGGAAAAIAFKLAAAGARSLLIVNRTVAKAEALAARLRAFAPQFDTAAVANTDGDAVRAALGQADLLIQATSSGLRPDDPPPIDLSWLNRRKQLLVFDTIYRVTPLLARARELGLPGADGKEMLIHQGAKSFEIWTGRPAPLTVMRRGFDAGR